MHKITLVLLGAVIIGGGCFWHRTPTTETTAQNTAVIAQETTAQTDSPAPAETKKSASQKATTKQTAPVDPAILTDETVLTPEDNTPADENEPSGSTWAFTPAPDTAAFKNEPLLDLSARKLNPLAAHVPAPDTTVHSPWQGEQLKFGLYYSFAKVGTAYIKNRGLIETNGKQAYVIQTTAFSAPVIDAVFKVRDINLSWLDAKNFSSLGYSQSLREGNYRRDEWVLFDYPANVYHGEVHKKSGSRSISGPLTMPVLDMLTALYFVRAQTLTKGKPVVFDIINREEQYPLVVKVVKHETVKTPAGKFKCIVVEPQFRGEGIFVSKGKSLKVWLTDDERKMPVKMKTEVFIGSVSAELLEYKVN